MFGLFPLLLLIAVIVGAVMLARSAGRSRTGGPSRPPSALELLNARYARGEIGRDEYLRTRADIGAGSPQPGAPT
ncbi:SHOCT domain-containing protein [Phenylobacterium soli]|nr:SHOCT domain-containing protein [Phenylobacterium soli]